MQKNISRFESLIRLIFGSLMFFFFLMGGPVWTIAGVYLMLTGSFRFCLFYYYLSNRTY
jgi:hypothetical protein